MKNTTQYLVITGALVIGFAGGTAIGLSEADEMASVKRLPGNIISRMNGEDTSKPVKPVQEIIRQYESDGSRITDIELDREMLRDIYEIELVDASGTGWDMDVDARTGEVLSRHRDWEWFD
jgi:uncharacterized membrane protein YkoI